MIIIRNTLMEALYAAISQGNLEAVADLVDQSPDLLQRQDENSKTAIFALPQHLPDESAVITMELFVQAGAELAHQDSNGRTVTFEVCAKGLTKCLTFILTQDKAAMHHRDRLGQTPLYSAVRNYQMALIRRMNIPADLLNSCDSLGQHTLLFYAAACGHDDFCMVLLKKGADPLAKDFCGQDILNYTSKTPRFQFEVRRLMAERKRQQDEEEARQYELGEQNQRVNLLKRKQAYQIRILRGVQTKRASKQERAKMMKRYQQMKQKELEQAYFRDPEFDEQNEYENNWRNIAIKIVRTCASSAAGRWFVHTNNSARAMLLVVNKTTRAIRAEARKRKTLEKKNSERKKKQQQKKKNSEEKRNKSKGKRELDSQEIQSRPSPGNKSKEKQKSGKPNLQWRPKYVKNEKPASGKQQSREKQEWVGRSGWRGRKPMGLSLIMDKLQHHVYRNSHEFVNDMQLIWVNAHQIYGPYDRITVYVHQLREYFYKLIGRYEYNTIFSH